MVYFPSFPTGFIAVLAGWYTAEVGRQPWVVYGLLRTTDAVTPSLTTSTALFSLVAICWYTLFIGFGTFYIFKLLNQGPDRRGNGDPWRDGQTPMAFADDAASATGNQSPARG